jgi:hypothetical protein
VAKLAVFNLVTAHGYFAGQGGDISWHTADAEFQEYAERNMLEEVRALEITAGKDLTVLGSGSMVARLTQAGLVGSRTFGNGNVLLRYEPAV